MNARTLMVSAVLLLMVSGYVDVQASGEQAFFYHSETGRYRYITEQSGDNYSFEFDNDPGGLDERLGAARHVLHSVFDDSSVDSQYSEAYTWERAKCFIFDGFYYSYRVCLPPNEFSPNSEDRFSGFITQIPNWKWLLTRNLLPALLVIGLFLFFTRNRETS